MSTHKMSGLLEVDCRRCGRRHALSAEQVRMQRVLHCACGQFVRMDRALLERRSEPVLASAAPRASLAEDELARRAGVSSGRARASQVSLSGEERPSQPARPFPSAARSSSAPPSADKPLWYVDLGGAETVQMTIEQLIIARRSGKLGEGALVWRMGMARWRPVGELIPASSPGRPSPPPPPPSTLVAQPQPRAQEPPAAALGSYERPLATLEFALEQQHFSAPREPSKLTQGSLLSRLERSSQPPRAPTPIPQRAQLPELQRRASPAPQRPPTPLPPIPSPPAAPAMRPSLASFTASSTPPAVASTAPVTVPFSRPEHSELFNEGPRWRTLSLALLLSIGASGSGAFLVRALRSHHQPVVVAPAEAPLLPATSFAKPSPPPTSTVRAAAASEPAPRVVALSSLSIERTAPRAQPRPVVPTPVKASEPAADAEETESAEPAPSAKPKPGDVTATEPSTERAGVADDSGVKKASGEEPGL